MYMPKVGEDVVFYHESGFRMHDQIASKYDLGTITAIERTVYTTYCTIKDRADNQYSVRKDQIHSILSFALFLEASTVEETIREAVLLETAKDLKGFNINEQDALGNTVLHMPTTLADPILIQVALKMGAKSLRNKNGFSPYEIAVLYDYLDAVDILKPTEESSIQENIDPGSYRQLCEGLASANGYVREKSLMLLGKKPQALPDILLCCNDWVKENRARALVNAIRLIPQCDSSIFTKALESLKKLQYAERCSREAYTILERKFCAYATSSLDVSILSKLPKAVRNYAYELFIWKKVLSHSQAIAAYQLEGDLWLKRNLLDYVYMLDPQTPDLYEDAINNKHSLLRQCGVWCKYHKLNDTWDGVENLLLDKCNGIQDAAIYILQNHTSMDLREFFTKQIAIDPTVSAIKGIEKCGDKESARSLVEIIPQLSGKRLKQAIYTVSVLLKGECEHIYWEYMENPSAAVRKTAIKALGVCGWPAPKDVYNKCIALGNTPEVKHLINILLRTNSWKRLAYTLRLYLDPNFESYKKRIYCSFFVMDMYGSMTKEEQDYAVQVLENDLVEMKADQKTRLLFALKHITIVE